MMNIKTRQINPPIPIRDYDWEATWEDYDEGHPIGYGKTEEEAIQDLKDQKS